MNSGEEKETKKLEASNVIVRSGGVAKLNLIEMLKENPMKF